MRDRSPEELDAILQAFPDIFEAQFGKSINPALIERVLTDLLNEKELDLIKQRFFDFSPSNLREIIERIKTKPRSELTDSIDLSHVTERANLVREKYDPVYEPVEIRPRGRRKKVDEIKGN